MEEVSNVEDHQQNGNQETISEMPPSATESTQRAFFTESEPVVHETTNNFEHEDEEEVRAFCL